ncbi:hypothetical protein CPB84DRAFT_789547 [Gymnopilus junonius]|uniref:Uncharacterized protein n=1 Tax=Gymnopilus junonius TaxID=109634 RepID=A0A9P5TNS9_GYMJU|nr:hypothetical protein CPB84DRAFT_789547 [Gymnopilus junonius]
MESPPAKKDFILFNLTAPSENVSAAQRHLYDVHRLHYLLAENDAYVQDSPRAASSTPVDIDPGDHLAGSYREPDWSPTSTAVDTSGDLSAEMWHLKLDESDSDEGPSLKQTGYSGHVRVEQPSAGTSIMRPGALDSGQYREFFPILNLVLQCILTYLLQQEFGYLAQLTIIQPSIRRPANKEAVYTDLLIDTGSTTRYVFLC